MYSTEEKWEALLAVEKEAARIRAEVNQLPKRTQLLECGIKSGSAWERSAALTFLRLLPEDVPRMLEPLVDLCLSAGWAQSAREALWPARHEIEMSTLSDLVLHRLSDSDADDYLMLADMLTYIEAWPTLAEVIDWAGRAGDAEVRKVGEKLLGKYSGLLP